MNKLFYSFVLVSLLVVGLVFAQIVDTPVSPVSDFEKLVVKEHFVTKKELKDHIDKKVLEYQKTTEEQLVKSFDEVSGLIDSKINKLVFKLVASVFAVVFFAGSLWLFFSRRLIRKYEDVVMFRSSKSLADDSFKKLSKSEDFKGLQAEKSRLLKDYEALKSGSGK